MEQIIPYLASAIVALIVGLGLLLVRDGRDGQVKRAIAIAEHLHKQVYAWVVTADKQYNDILLDYAEQAQIENKDPRLLWVIDQAEAYAKKTFNVSIDLNAIIAQVERVVKELKH